jgi:hypothetical protein
MADLLDLERLDAELVAAEKVGDRERVKAVLVEYEKIAPCPAPPRREPPPDGKTWRDIGDGWQELSSVFPGGERVICGVASSDAINAHDYAVSPSGMAAVLPIPLRCGHDLQGGGVGKVYLFRRNASIVYFEAALSDGFAADYAWEKILDATFQSVSLGWEGRGHEMKVAAVVDGKTFYEAWLAGELSLCRQGANPDASLFILTESRRDRWRDLCVRGGTVQREPKTYYRGIWKSDVQYQAGEFVTHQGSLWASTIDSTGCRPGDGIIWKLAVKRGTAEKLEMPDGR